MKSAMNSEPSRHAEGGLPRVVAKFLALSSVVSVVVMNTSAAVSIEKSEFIYERAAFPSCHASTIAETKSGLIAAWFGGSNEGNSDVSIWSARHDGQSWSAPVEVATSVQADGKRFPWPR